MDWIGFGSAFTSSLWIGLDWVIELMDWIGLDLENWTHVQLWPDAQDALASTKLMDLEVCLSNCFT